MFQKRVIIFFFGFLFLQNQFFSVAIADTCKNFYKAVTEQAEPIYPLEEVIDLGIYFSYVWDETEQKKIINRNKNKFPIIKFSLLEDKLTPGTVIKTINDKNLSKEDDDSLQKLVENSKSAEIEFYDENKINKIKLSSKKYNAIYFFFDNFVLNSINEIVAKEGFFEIDYTTSLKYKRTDLKKEGRHLLHDTCPYNEDLEKKLLFYPDDGIILNQFEIDKDKTYNETFFNYSDKNDITWLKNERGGIAKIRSRFDFSKFPFDTQVLNITYRAAGDLISGVFKDEDRGTLFLITPSDDLVKNLNFYRENNYLQEWKVVRTQANSEFKKNRNNEFVDTLTLALEIERNKLYYFAKIIIPVLLILSVAWYVLWIPTDDVESRLTTSIVALLSLIAYNFVFQDDIPKLDILTSLDQFILLSYIFCAIPIFTTIRLSRTIEKNKKRSSYLNQLIRRWGLVIYVFGTLTIFYRVM
jgi:hypothetical protein